jgi:hypothetical protein
MNKLVILFLICSSNGIFAQNNWGLEAKVHSGYLAVHRPTIAHLPKDPVFAGELTYFLDLKEGETWAKAYATPRIGITTFYTSTGNLDILGSLFGGFAFGDLPFYRTDKHSFSARVGSGLAIASKVFDPISNPKNNAISAHVNVIVQMSLNYRFYSRNNEFGIGMGLNHFSNGANKLPNLGLNYPTLTLSYGNKRGIFRQKERSKYAGSWKAPWDFGINFILSAKDISISKGKKYPIYALNVFARKVFSSKCGVEFGLDGIYKTALLEYLPEFEKKPIDIFQGGFFTGYVLTFDRFSTVLGMGFYFKDRYLPEDHIYHRIGMRYKFKNNLLVGVTLKSNWGKADYVEWSVGYVFNKKK